jgi:hypothetical protein
VRAFHLLPSIHKALSAGSYASVRHLLWTSGSDLRFGYPAQPDTTTFVAYPTWQGDSLAFVPWPLRQLSKSRIVPAGIGLAVRHERQLFHDIATAWASAFPRSVESQEALAVSLELLGDPAALDTIRRVRALAATSEEQVRLAGTHVWMLVKFSIPSDTAGVWAARHLADSILSGVFGSGTQQPNLLISLAALTGHARLGAAVSRGPAFIAEWEIPAPIRETAGPLLVFASLGGPGDSLKQLEREVAAAIEAGLPESGRQDVRSTWLGRAAGLEFPANRSTLPGSLAGHGNYLLDAEAAFARNDTLAVRRVLGDIKAARRSAPASDLTFDALYPEAWLLASLGDPQAAIAWLDPTLGELAAAAPQKFVDPANAGALVQAMALRADLAERIGNHRNASKRARVVCILWGDADPFLQPTVLRMRALSGQSPVRAESSMR